MNEQSSGHITNRVGVNNKVIAHDWQCVLVRRVTCSDLCCFHLHKEEETLITLEMYGMDRSPPNVDSETLPNTVEGVSEFVEKVTSRVELKDHSPAVRRLRRESEPFNAVNACSIEEDRPKKGEVCGCRG